MEKHIAIRMLPGSRVIFRGRLHDEREFDVMRTVQHAFVNRSKERCVHAVELEEFLRNSLVLAKEQPARASTCVWNVQQVHVCCDGHVLGVIAGIGFGEIDEGTGRYSEGRKMPGSWQISPPMRMNVGGLIVVRARAQRWPIACPGLSRK